ncbi:hypothetical protein [Flavihumibacter sp. CACIAM 22H1]|uniref:hypothetical protein n=1 Tax=Flavihumibacter sp. CACIAM 22H1 TaxID=1812911 RepID=UPI0007A82AD0|nr:hypothetical protein [Flavihumibacter sp. CACIAM 22H1]KYP12950.1 MAG: hypothetical protein A1D16_15805 [Flavihumibacter sp. CACIAM 22H1]
MTNNMLSAQQANRQRFAKAVVYAKNSLANPAVVAAYAAIIQGPRQVYLAALKDALRAPLLVNLQTNAYTGAVGDLIRVQAMDDFKVVQVEFKLFATDGSLLECGQAIRSNNGLDWIYTTLVCNPQPKGSTVLVRAMDLPRNHCELTQVL